MAAETLLLTCFSLLILSLHFFQTSHANTYCTPSACGVIRNISYPFRLKNDPKNCGHIMYQLACENNVTTIVLDYKKYHVKAINYHNFTIRVAEVSINNNICSFPKHSLYLTNFSTFGYPYSIYRDTDKTADHEVAWPINFMSCPYPLMNSSLFTGCGRGGSSYGNGRYAYVKVGHTNVSALKVSCRVDLTVMTSWKFKDSNNVSLSEIHDSLLYGFELSWFNFDMDFAHFTLQIIWCKYATLKFNQLDQNVLLPWKQQCNCTGYPVSSAHLKMYTPVFMFAGISLAAMIIVGLLICAPVLLVITNNPTLFGYYSVVWVVLNPTLIVGAFLIDVAINIFEFA
ncbi:hypothetical protein C2S52_018822 [Perilla frutescens var. hirtella]|nr:hypothetical protein C2S52_018822 [Perilla frutescens var. hirtella]